MLKVTLRQKIKGWEEHRAVLINHFMTTDLFLSHKANNFLADEDKEPCSSPCASSMAEDSEEDSIPSNECKKVNDQSASRRGAEAMGLNLGKAWRQSTVLFPQEVFFLYLPFAQSCILWKAVADMGCKAYFLCDLEICIWNYFLLQIWKMLLLPW